LLISITMALLMVLQHKLNLTLQEYRGMHKQSSRGQLPHNKLIYPETLRYLSLWVLGDATSFLSLQVLISVLYQY
jgi:hypothetical protein